MRRTGALAAAAVLAIVGVIMLGAGVMALRNSPTAADSIAESGALETPPATGTLSEVSNPVAGPDPDADTPVPRLDVDAPPEAIDLVPTRVRIPSIDVNAGVIDLGLNPDRTLQVPEDISVTGWYTGRSVPGEKGPSVVVGHVDSAVAGAGVFFNLRELQPGDTIEVERSDGSIAEFLVTDIMLVDKDEFPTAAVYGATDRPALRLITCGGGFDRSARSYVSNVIVFAEHLGNRQAPLSRS